jgi:hypothetical protein
MAVCECGHPEERHDVDELICLVPDCACEEFLEVYSGEEEIFGDFYERETFNDDELVPEDENGNFHDEEETD